MAACWQAVVVSGSLYEAGAEFFKTLGRPLRARVLELMSSRRYAAVELVTLPGVESAQASQQLAVLRRANLVVAPRDGSSVSCVSAGPHVAELLAATRAVLSTVLSGRAELLPERRASLQVAPPEPRAP